MEWTRKFDQLNQTDKTIFKKMINQMLSKTFLIRDSYDMETGRMKVHSDYRFVERHFELFMGYLELGGWTLHRDSNYGVIHIDSAHDFNRQQLSKFNTLVLFTLRLIFEENREEVQLRKEVIIEIGSLVQKMNVLGVLEKRPAIKELTDALKVLASFNLIARLEGGKWETMSTRIMILPSILFVIPNEKISVLSELTNLPEDGEVDEIEEFEEMEEVQ